MKKHSFHIIDGQFQVDHAREVLQSMIISKIHFHQSEQFRIWETTGNEALHSVSRIKELRVEQQNLNELFAEAEKQDCDLIINGTITIEFVPKNASENHLSANESVR
jgi:hypothetical protein